MGTLTGQTFKMADPQTQKLVDEWRYFYPINYDANTSSVDPVVEVILCEYLLLKFKREDLNFKITNKKIEEIEKFTFISIERHEKGN